MVRLELQAFAVVVDQVRGQQSLLAVVVRAKLPSNTPRL
jgi:hypothetical protein